MRAAILACTSLHNNRCRKKHNYKLWKVFVLSQKSVQNLDPPILCIRLRTERYIPNNIMIQKFESYFKEYSAKFDYAERIENLFRNSFSETFNH